MIQPLASWVTQRTFPTTVRRSSERDVDQAPKGLMSRCVIHKPSYVINEAVWFYNDEVHEWRQFRRHLECQPLNVSAMITLLQRRFHVYLLLAAIWCMFMHVWDRSRKWKRQSRYHWVATHPVVHHCWAVDWNRCPTHHFTTNPGSMHSDPYHPPRNSSSDWHPHC